MLALKLVGRFFFATVHVFNYNLNHKSNGTVVVLPHICPFYTQMKPGQKIQILKVAIKSFFKCFTKYFHNLPILASSKTNFNMLVANVSNCGMQ